MPLSRLNDLSQLSKENRKYYDALMVARDIVMKQMNHHASVALDNGDAKHGATHIADYGGEDFRRDIELQMLTEDGNVLELIEDAIGRLMSGEYGKCVDCDQPIAPGRLEVKPYALYCTSCKSIREKNDGINPYFD